MRPSSVFPALFSLFLFISGVTARPVWTGQEGPASGKPDSSSRQTPIRERLPEIGQALERDLKEGETHVFETTLTAGKFLEVTVEQLGIDVSVEIRTGAGKSLLKVNTLTGKEEAETVGWVADRAGRYEIVVIPNSREKQSGNGRYRLVVTTRRPATERDRALGRGMLTFSRALAPDTPPSVVRVETVRAFTMLAPLLEADDPRLFSAAMTFARQAQSKDDWLQVARMFEAMLPARERHGAAPDEILKLVKLLRTSYVRSGTEERVEIVERYFLREIELTAAISGEGSVTLGLLLAETANFYLKFLPEKVPTFLELWIDRRSEVAELGNAKVEPLLELYAENVTPETVERFNQFLDQKIARQTAGERIESGTAAKNLIALAEIIGKVADRFVILGASGEAGPEGEVRRAIGARQRERVGQLYRQALQLLASEKNKFQHEYLRCLQGLRNVSQESMVVDEAPLLAFAREIKTLNEPEVVTELLLVSTDLGRTYSEQSVRLQCQEEISDRHSRRERLRRVYEESIRLVESIPKSPQSKTKAEADNTPAEEKDTDDPPAGQNPRDLETVFFRYASFLLEEGDTAHAREVLERGLACREPLDEERTHFLLRFAAGFDLTGDEPRAAALYRDAVEWSESASDEKVVLQRLKVCLAALAGFHERYGRFDEAEKQYRRLYEVANRMKSRSANPNDETISAALWTALVGLVGTDAARGDETGFEAHRRLLLKDFPEIFSKEAASEEGEAVVRNFESPRLWIANTFRAYATFYAVFGNRERVAVLSERLLSVTRDTPDDLPALEFLAADEFRKGNQCGATPALERVFRVRLESAPATAIPVLGLMIEICPEQAVPDRLIPLFEQAIPRIEKMPNAANSLEFLLWNLERLYRQAGRREDALRTFEKVKLLRGITEMGVPISVREDVSLALWRDGRTQEAMGEQMKANEQREMRLTQLMLAFITDPLKSPLVAGVEAFLRQECVTGRDVDRTLDFSQEISRTVSLQAGMPTDPNACRGAFESVLRRKARSVDQSFEEAVRHRKPDVETWGRLGDVMSTFYNSPWSSFKVLEKSNPFFSEEFCSYFEAFPEDMFVGGFQRFKEFDGPIRIGSSQASITKLKDETLDPVRTIRVVLETVLNRRPALRPLLTPITLEAVQKSLPTDGALVEVVRYAPFNPKTGTTEGEERYAVYVLTPQGEPKWFDGGTASEIDAAANLLANEARNYADEESKAAVTVLENRFIAPALKLTGNAKRVYVAFDERLASLPLKKLVNAEGKSFGESRGLVFIRGGRELLNPEIAR